MSNITTDIVQKLWNLCNVLRDDGITYHQYVNELTYLLFLKMADETGSEKQIPENYRWEILIKKGGQEQLDFYKELLLELGRTEKTSDEQKQVLNQIQMIYANANTAIREAKNLNTLITEINKLDWYSAREEGLGDLYEGLLEKNANEKKSGAGQYFTPRPLIDCIVDLMQPQPKEIIQDPAMGTGGFLIAAHRYIVEKHDLFNLPEEQVEFQVRKAYYGMELVQDTQRLAMMNALLHNIEGTFLLGDTLSSNGKDLPPADLVITNPPFGTKKGGGTSSRDDFTYITSNKQLAFLQHIYRTLKPGGRAAVVLPDNVLFESNIGQQIRADLMDKCNLHTILRLPTGIFYAQGVKTNVLFFTRGTSDTNNTQEIWIYDMRTNMPSFGKTTPLTRKHFAEFETAYNANPRQDGGEKSRFRKFTREEIKKREDNLDISWLQDDSVESVEDLPEPEVIAEEIMEKLRLALGEMEEMRDIL